LWDTRKDYRLLVAEKSVELFLRTMEGANLKGKWNKKLALQAAKKMIPEIQTLYYSYLSPDDLAETPQLISLLDSYGKVIVALGGDNWQRQFLERGSREEKEKIEDVLSKIKFFLNIIIGLKTRFKMGEIKDPIIGIDIKKGEILSVFSHPRADGLMISNVNLRERVITVVTNDLQVRKGDQVAVALLPPENFMGTISEGMFLGAAGGVLKDVDGDLGQLPRGIPLESLNETRNLIESFLNH
jgi:uncharacterized protein